MTYGHTNMIPLHHIVSDGERWYAVPAIVAGWTKRRPLAGKPNGLEAGARPITAGILGLPA